MFAQIMLIIQFLNIIAPLVNQIYAAVRALFPDGTPGATKMDTFKALVLHLVQTTEELKKFVPIFETAWPAIRVMVEAFHTDFKTKVAN